jgi:phosphatidylethanolamine-binding protein (PEBP) family uncharacterized protein
MKVTSAGIQDGIIADVYGQRGHRNKPGQMVTYSLPLSIAEAPAGTVSYAIVIEDKDAVPGCGFSWIHWLGANLQRPALQANESVTATDYIQGTNSWSGKLGGLDRLARASMVA